MQKLLVDEGGADTVIYRVPYSDYFKTDTKVFRDAEDWVLHLRNAARG